MPQSLTEAPPLQGGGRIRDPFGFGQKRQSWADFARGANGGAGFNWGIAEPHNFAQEFAQKTGFQGNPLQQGAPTSFFEGESGRIADPSSSWAINPEFEKHLGQYTWEGGVSGKNEHPWARAYDPSGSLVGQFTTGDNGSRNAEAAMKAAVAAIAGAGAWQQFGPGFGSLGDGGSGFLESAVGGSSDGAAGGFMDGAFGGSSSAGGLPSWAQPTLPTAGQAPTGWRAALSALAKPFSFGVGATETGGAITGTPWLDTILKGALPAAGALGAQRLIAGSPPDYASALRDAATQQGQANLQAGQATAGINRVNTSTPYGSQNFRPVQDPSWPGGVRWEQNISLSPEQQKLYDLESGNQIAGQEIAGRMQGSLQSAVAQPFSLSSVGQAATLPGSEDAFSAERERVTKSLYDRLSGLRKPQMDQAKAQLDTRLRQQGHMPSDQAYLNAMRDLDQQQSQELADIAQRAEAAGGAEQSRLFEMLKGGAGFNNQVRGQGIQELLLQRQQPLAEYNAFRTGNTPTLPTFQPFGMGSASPAPIAQGAQAAYGAAADTYNNRIGQLQQLLNFFSKTGG